jgi:hypothetical protein
MLLEELGLPYTPPGQPQPGHHQQHANGSNGSGANDSGNGSGGNGAGPQPGRPLLAVVSRLTVQKGLPLILHGIRTAIARGAQVVVLGTASEPEVQRQWEDMAREFGRGGDARLVLRYDEGLAHRIYAGADMILVGPLGGGRGEGGGGCRGGPGGLALARPPTRLLPASLRAHAAPAAPAAPPRPSSCARRPHPDPLVLRALRPHAAHLVALWHHPHRQPHRRPCRHRARRGRRRRARARAQRLRVQR